MINILDSELKLSTHHCDSVTVSCQISPTWRVIKSESMSNQWWCGLQYDSTHHN
jgi:hypothetical protein